MVGDLGAGPFDRFDSSPELKKKQNEAKLKERQRVKIAIEECKDKSTKQDAKEDKKPKSRKSSEGGFHSDCSVEKNVAKLETKKKTKKKKKKRKRSKSRTKSTEQNQIVAEIDNGRDILNEISLNVSPPKTIPKSYDDDGKCKDCLMDCGKPNHGNSYMDFR